MRREHAEHNEKACNLLFESGAFPDWVITTAFYSALHYLQYEAFPRKEGDDTFNDFDDYYNHVKIHPACGSKHEQAIKLSEVVLTGSGPAAYRWLHDRCHTARYKDYQVSEQRVKTCIERLKLVKESCTKLSVEIG